MLFNRLKFFHFLPKYPIAACEAIQCNYFPQLGLKKIWVPTETFFTSLKVMGMRVQENIAIVQNCLDIRISNSLPGLWLVVFLSFCCLKSHSLCPNSKVVVSQSLTTRERTELSGQLKTLSNFFSNNFLF